jgi:hypothetical protein
MEYEGVGIMKITAFWSGAAPIELNGLLALVAAVLLLGVIGEKDKDKNKNITSAFWAVVVLIIALNTIM